MILTNNNKKKGRANIIPNLEKTTTVSLHSGRFLACCGLIRRGFVHFGMDETTEFGLSRPTYREPAARRQRSTFFHNYYSSACSSDKTI
jgi:hypothetical protein